MVRKVNPVEQDGLSKEKVKSNDCKLKKTELMSLSQLDSGSKKFHCFA